MDGAGKQADAVKPKRITRIRYIPIKHSINIQNIEKYA
jgi:hypothetical protein